MASRATNVTARVAMIRCKAQRKLVLDKMPAQQLCTQIVHQFHPGFY